MSSSDKPLAADSYGTPDRWFVLSLVSLNYFTLYLHRSLLSYIQPSLVAELGLSDAQLGLLQQAFLLPYCAAQIFVGYLSDRFRRRSVLVASLALSVASLACAGLAQGFVELYVWRVLLALAQAASVPAIAGVMADCFRACSRSKAVSIYLLSSPLSLVVAGWLGGGIADWKPLKISFEFVGGGVVELAGWRMAHFLFAAFGAAVVLLLASLLREPIRTERAGGAGLGDSGGSLRQTLFAVLSVRTYLALATVYVLAMIAMNPFLYWSARYFHDTFGMTQSQAGFFATFWPQTGMVVGLLGGGLLADVWSRRSMRGRSYVALIGLVLWIPSLLVIGTSHSTFTIAAAMLAMGLGTGLYLGNLWTTTFEVIDPAARSTSIGLLNVASGLFASWSAPAVGALHDKNVDFGTMFAASSLVAAASAVVLALSIFFLLPSDYRRTTPTSSLASEG